jgi:hypothetical protein
VAAFEIGETKTGRKTMALHSFFRMGDGSALAFFEVPDMPFQFKPQHDYDLHIALEVEGDVLEPMMEQARAAGVEVRGIPTTASSTRSTCAIPTATWSS